MPEESDAPVADAVGPAIVGAKFPTDKGELKARARVHRAGPEVVARLERLPESAFASLDELERALARQEREEEESAARRTRW